MTTFAKDLLDAMPDEILHYRWIGDDDGAGNEVWAKTPRTLPANIVVTMRAGGIEDRDGQLPPTTPVTGTIIVLGGDIRPRDKIAFLGVTKMVDTIQTFRDAPNPGDYVQQITFDEEK
jgi:hypothetical protein